MKFTSKEWEIICHRLAVPDALAECLSDEDAETDYDGMYWACRELEATGGDIPNPTEHQLEILRDCCDGCTFFADWQDAVAVGAVKRGSMMAAFQAAKGLEQKLGVEVRKF